MWHRYCQTLMFILRPVTRRHFSSHPPVNRSLSLTLFLLRQDLSSAAMHLHLSPLWWCQPGCVYCVCVLVLNVCLPSSRQSRRLWHWKKIALCCNILNEISVSLDVAVLFCFLLLLAPEPSYCHASDTTVWGKHWCYSSCWAWRGGDKAGLPSHELAGGQGSRCPTWLSGCYAWYCISLN